jgi:exonuclease VII small subunit
MVKRITPVKLDLEVQLETATANLEEAYNLAQKAYQTYEQARLAHTEISREYQTHIRQILQNNHFVPVTLNDL